MHGSIPRRTINNNAMKNLLFFLIFVAMSFAVSVACLAIAIFVTVPLWDFVGPLAITLLWMALLMMAAHILDGAMDRFMMSRFAREWWTKGN